MKKIKNIFQIFFYYFFSLIVFSLIFFGLIRLPIFKKEEVLFYRGLIILFITTFVSAAILFSFGKKIKPEQIIACLVFCFSVHLVFFVVFPVTFERSVTMFLLQTINANQGIDKSSLERVLITDYIQKNNALEKRLKEQKEIDFLKLEKNKVFLTEKGKKFLEFSKVIKKIYDINQ